VKAGDRVHFDIAEAVAGSNVWTFSAKNLTSGKTWTMTLPYSSTHATAEWIEETPVSVSSNGQVSIGPMPSLGKVTFDNGTINGANPGLKASEELQLVPSTTPVAVPSAPDSDTNGFSDCTYASSCATPAS
jgi:hypothetical protein